MKKTKIKVIGCGGIASCLLPILCRYCNYEFDSAEISLIDGDQYEERNAARQRFDEQGDKATVTKNMLDEEFPNIWFFDHPTYLTKANINKFIREGDVVFSCVDNHATRKLISDHCETLQNVIIFSGGNEYSDGAVQIYWRANGEDKTLPLANELHPEVTNPTDENPGERKPGCEAQMPKHPQLLFANNAAAVIMLGAFYAYLEGNLNYDEVYFDVSSNTFRSVRRKNANS